MNATEHFFDYIETEFSVAQCDSSEFLYDHMDSQSGFFLPFIYQPFDPDLRSHWRDRGSIFDFLAAADCYDSRVLDLGPGDGWPSLLIAPYVKEVVGVEGSRRRLETCVRNAERMNIHNAHFAYVSPGEVLPFDDACFDAVVGACSLEQTPDPCNTLRELYRVLKKGGKLRLEYESLESYRGVFERDFWITDTTDSSSMIILYDRKIDDHMVIHYRLDLNLPARKVVEMLRARAGLNDSDVSPEKRSRLWISSEEVRELIPAEIVFNVENLEYLGKYIEKVYKLKLHHPDGRLLCRWLMDAGFSSAFSTYGGSEFAGRIFDALKPEQRPLTCDEVDALLRPAITAAVSMESPLHLDTPVTGIK